MSIIQIGSGYSGGIIAAGDTVEGSGTVTPILNNGSLLIGSTDTVQVSGSGSTGVDVGFSIDTNASVSDYGTLDASGNEVVVGDSGNGVLSVSDGGSLVAGSTANSDIALDLGLTGSGSGTLEVSSGSTTSTATIDGELVVGDSGYGSLAVGSGGSLSLDNASTSGLIVGNNATSAGQITVTGGTIDTADDPLVIGDFGAGAVTISSGSLSVGTSLGDVPAVDIGEWAGSSGTLVVTGTSASFSAFGQLTIGDSGEGALIISAGGSVNTGGNAVQPGGGIALGFDSGGNGELIVTDPNSVLNNVGQFTVGGDTSNSVLSGDLGEGVGTVRILNGATINTNPDSGYSGPAADIAADTGTDGSSVTVSGTNSTWNIGGSLVVGDAAAGSLGVSAGGAVSATNLIIGNQSGASGNVSVGSGSTMTLSGTLTAGAAGTGDLDINNGGFVQAANAQVGSSGGSGVIDLEGSLSELNVTNNMTITDGVVVVGAGSTLNVHGALDHTALGVLQQLGGLVDPTTYTNSATLGPTGTFVATISLTNDTGTILGQGGTELVASPIISDGGSGNGGILAIGAGGNLFINAGTVDNSQTVKFQNGTSFGVLTIGSISGFGAVISNFNTHAEIVLQSVTIQNDASGDVTGVVYGAIDPIASTQFVSGGESDGDNALLLYSGPSQTGLVIGTLDLSLSLTTAQLNALETVNAQGGLGALPCFAAGTLIRTDRGDIAVEDLRLNDTLPTLLFGSSRIVWIGHRTVDCTRHPAPRKVWPVRVRAGAFGPSLPERDLFLSPDHALYVEEVLIPVRCLIDDGAIAQVPMDAVTYYHIELARHDVVLAEGLPAESFLDTGGKRMFDNAGPIALHPDFAIRVWEAEGCAPLVVIGPEVIAAKRMLRPGRRAA